MKNRRLYLIILCSFFLCSASCGDTGTTNHGDTDQTENGQDNGTEENGNDNNGGGEKEPDKVLFHERAREMFDIVNRHFRISPEQSAGLYREEAGGSAISFLWPYDAMVTATMTLHRLGYDVDYRGIVDNYEKYHRYRNGLHGYGSSTDGTYGGGTRYYDDNSIVGIELVEAYRLTGEKRFLDRCGVVYEFLRSGVDDIMGKALWWNEDQVNIPGDDNSNKPACSNGYAVNFLLNYHEIAPVEIKEEVLEFAETLYSWLRENLMDPEDHTYWNDKNAAGNINTTKWTYNSGVMAMNGVGLYRITGESRYLDHAVQTATGAYDLFVRARNGVAAAYPQHDPWFNTKLLEAYVAIAPFLPAAKTYIENYADFIDHGYAKARTAEGFFYEDWTGGNPGRYSGLLFQAAVIESYGRLALYYGEEYIPE